MSTICPRDRVAALVPARDCPLLTEGLVIEFFGWIFFSILASYALSWLIFAIISSLCGHRNFRLADQLPCPRPRHRGGRLVNIAGAGSGGQDIGRLSIWRAALARMRGDLSAAIATDILQFSPRALEVPRR